MIFGGLLFEKMETAAVAAGTCFFVNVKPILFSLPYVISIAKQAAQLRAAVFGAGGVPKAFLNRDIKAAPTAVLCTFPP